MLACPGCGKVVLTRITIVCPVCGTLTSKAIRMNATEREAVERNYTSSTLAGKKIEGYTQEDQEKDIKDLYG